MTQKDPIRGGGILEREHVNKIGTRITGQSPLNYRTDAVANTVLESLGLYPLVQSWLSLMLATGRQLQEGKYTMKCLYMVGIR